MSETDTLRAEAAMRIDAYLAEKTELSRSQAQRLVKQEAIRVNGMAVKPNHMLGFGDEIEIQYPETAAYDTLPEDIPLTILYEDADLLVVDKPQGMVVHPAPGHASGTLVNALLYAVDDLSGVGGAMRPGIVHRIDRMTSGLLVVAKNDKTHRALSEQFGTHDAHRSYLAIALGNFKEDGGTIRARIGRHHTDRKKMAVTQDGREATTHWRVLERFGAYTLLLLVLETGRTHQIRVHLSSIGHPVAGDEVYGGGKKTLGLDGQALHGYRLTFTHPTTGETHTFVSPPPSYFCAALKRAGCSRSAEEVVLLANAAL